MSGGGDGAHVHIRPDSFIRVEMQGKLGAVVTSGPHILFDFWMTPKISPTGPRLAHLYTSHQTLLEEHHPCLQSVPLPRMLRIGAAIYCLHLENARQGLGPIVHYLKGHALQNPC